MQFRFTLYTSLVQQMYYLIKTSQINVEVSQHVSAYQRHREGKSHQIIDKNHNTCAYSKV